MIVAEFIEWLKTQDQGATVEILFKVSARGYEGDSFRRVDFDVEKHVDYIDMRGNQFGIGKPYENSRTLFLGGED